MSTLNLRLIRINNAMFAQHYPNTNLHSAQCQYYFSVSDLAIYSCLLRHSNCNVSISRMTLCCSATSNSIYLPIRVGTCSGAAPGYRLQPGDGCGVLTLVCPHQSCLAQPPTDSESVYSQSQHPPFEMQRLHSTRCHVAFSQYRCQVSLSRGENM